MKITYEKYVIRVRHYTEHMKECHFKDDFPEDIRDCVADFIYWQTSHEDFYVSKYTDTEIKISDNIWEANDYSDVSKEEIDEIIKDLKNHYKPKKDYRIQLKKVKATV